jgi:hypothetical protein
MPKVEIDDTEPPIIDVLVESLTWDEISNYIRVSQRFLLVEDGGKYKGIYRAGNGVAVADELGTDRDKAVSMFRDFLRQPRT